MSTSTWLPALRVHDRAEGPPWSEVPPALGAAFDAAASAPAVHVYQGAGFVLTRGAEPWSTVRASSTEALERVLGICARERWACTLDTSGVVAGPLPEGLPALRQVYHRAEGGHDGGAPQTTGTAGGTLHIDVAGGAAVRQAVTLFDAPADEVVFSPAGAVRATPPFTRTFPARVARFLAAIHAVESPRRLRPEDLDAFTTLHDLPRWPSLAALEQEVGGLVAPDGRDPLAPPWLLLGLALCVAAPDALRREWSWLGEESNADDDTLVEMDTGLRWRWRDWPLVLVGQWQGTYALVFCDERGAMWRYEHEWGHVEVVAGSARSFLGQLAVMHEVYEEIRGWAAIRVLAGAGAAVAAELGLAPVPEASDDLVGCYHGAGVWLWQQEPHGPARRELRIVSDDLQAIVRAVGIARRAAPGAAVEVDVSRPGGVERLEALRKAGLAA